MRGFNKNINGTRIIHLTDGQQALDYLFYQGVYSDKVSSPRPHLILLDLRLPKVDGLEVLRLIKMDKVLRSIPTVILSTSEADDDISQAYAYYANSYLVKPTDFTKFSNMVESFRFYWVKWNKYS
jgi:CheY-like chemotaxis protein